MKPLITLPYLLVAACVAGCTSMEPLRGSPGQATALPQPCQAAFLNTPGSMSWINGSLGKEWGFDRPVASLSGTADTSISDRLALKLPSGDANGSAAFSCYATAHFVDGTSQDGILSIADAGPSQPLKILWIDRATVERTRATYAMDTQKRQQEGIAYGARLQACTLQWKIAVQAKSMLRSGMTEAAVEEGLVADYAYGRDGQVYRDSEGTEAMVRQVAATVAMSAEQRSKSHAPDYASQQFLDRCSLQSAESSR